MRRTGAYARLEHDRPTVGGGISDAISLRRSCDCVHRSVGDSEVTADGGRCGCLRAADARHQFFDFLESDVLLVAHNNRFDMKMLQQECAKFDCCFEPDGVELCDTLALSRHLRPDLESHALGNLLEPLGVEGVNSHDALDDVMACAGVFFKLLS